MIRVFSILAALLVSLNAFAAGIRFEPAAPDNRSSITAHVYSTWCIPMDPKVTVAGDRIDIQLVNATFAGCIAIPFFIPIEAQIGIVPPGVYRVRVLEGWASNIVAEETLVVRDTRAMRIFPAGAPAAGGTTVELRRTTEADWIVHPYATTTVQFGNEPPVSITPWTDWGRLLVKVPPHSPGVVDVKVTQTLDGVTTETIARTAFTYYDPAAAPDRAVFEPLLFPVAYDGPGALGSQWTTENWLSQGGATFFAAPCTACATSGSERVRLDKVSAPAGVVLWPARGMFEMLGASSRVRDLAKQADNAGAYVPLAREGDFRRALVFPDVPNDPKYRLMLRVWSFEDPQLEGMKRVAWGAGSGIRGSIDLLTTAAPGIVFGSADITTTLLPGTASMEITVGQSLHRVWGILSVTNNETQQVTIIAPRPGVPGER
ncbi:MAG: hypothetical protein WA208_03720 [Thermoanaerobaculia bacterium]